MPAASGHVSHGASIRGPGAFKDLLEGPVLGSRPASARAPRKTLEANSESETIDHSSDVAKLRLLERYFEYSLLEAQRTGRCVMAQNPEHGAAAWLLPRDAKTDALESATKLAFLERLLGSPGFNNYQSISSFMSPLAARHVSEDAWYLSIIGVHPSAQKKGIGQELLACTLSEADEKQATCYLETFTPRSISFYTRLGFKPAACYEEPTTRSTYVLMRRDTNKRMECEDARA